MSANECGARQRHGNAGLENLGQGFHAVRHGGDDQIRTGGKDLISFGRPGIFHDDGAGIAQFRTDIEAIFRASGEQVEPAKIAQSNGNTWLRETRFAVVAQFLA